MKFELHTIETAPQDSKQDLENAQKAYGTIPNLYRGFSDNPATLKAYLSLNDILAQHGGLSPVEQQVAYLSVSVENGCTYCVGAHSVLASMVDIPSETLAELRNQQALSNDKLNAIKKLTLSIINNKGFAPETDLQDFINAGYSQSHILEIITIIAQKTISNYFNHLANTPLDDMFKSQEWVK